MFDAASSKLEECHALLEQFGQVHDSPTFRSLFNALINAARAFTNSLQVEGRNIPGFNEWYLSKQKEMRGDELLRFIHESRIEDFHQGKYRIRFPATYIDYFSTDQAGQPPTPDASIVIGSEGPFWIINRGTLDEKRIPIRSGGTWITEVTIENAPSLHLGKKLSKNDPISICKMAITYFENLLREAKSKFY